MPTSVSSASKPGNAGVAPTTPGLSDSPQSAAALQVDASKVQACYANFCRVTGTPEELIVDFALNSQPFAAANEPLAATQRLVLNFYTAKRLLHALHLTIQRHEATFGVLETDIQRRVQTPARE